MGVRVGVRGGGNFVPIIVGEHGVLMPVHLLAQVSVTVVHVRQYLILLLRASSVKSPHGLLCSASSYTCGVFFQRPHGLSIRSNAKTPLLVGL